MSSVMASKLIRKQTLGHPLTQLMARAVSLRSTEAFNQSHNSENRNPSNPQLKHHVSARRATANLSMPHENAFVTIERDCDADEKSMPQGIRMDDLESYVPVGGE